MTTTPTRLLCVAASLALLGNACSNSSGSQESSVGDSVGDTAAVKYESPLADFLGFDTDYGSDESKTKQAQAEREGQEKVAACMRAEGFEYTPTSEGSFQTFGLEEDGLAYGSLAWVQKYGFGVSTQQFSQETVGPDLVGHDFGDFLSEPEPASDPNSTYVESLSEGDQTAYYGALYGNDNGPEYDESLSEEENEKVFNDYFDADFEPSGCFNEGFADLFGAENAFFETFADELEELQERFDADQRVAEVRSKTKSCIADKGFEYTDQDEVYQDLYERLGKISSGTAGGFILSEGAAVEQLTDDQVDEQFFEQTKLSDTDRQTLAEIQEYELGLALAVFECSGNSLDDSVNPTLQQIRIALEQEFLDVNKDRLTDFAGTAG